MISGCIPCRATKKARKRRGKSLQARNAGGDFPPVSFTRFEDAYRSLTEKLRPMVYDLGFLRV